MFGDDGKSCDVLAAIFRKSLAGDTQRAFKAPAVPPVCVRVYACACPCVCVLHRRWLHVCSEACSRAVTRYCKVLCERCHMSPRVFPSRKIDNRKWEKRRYEYSECTRACAQLFAAAQTRRQSETDGVVLPLYLPLPSER